MPTDNSECPPITLKRRSLACENTRYSVYLDELVDWRSGYTVPDYLVVAPKRTVDDMISGVSILPILEHQVVLLRNYRHAIARYVLEAPRGFIEGSEPPVKRAICELEEEVGLTCALNRIVPLGCCAPAGGLLAGRIALFVALECHRVARPQDRAEIGLGTSVILKPIEARELVTNMAIEDPITALALHRYLAHPLTR